MKSYRNMSEQELKLAYEEQKAAYEKCKAMGLKLNMARGKPSKAQIDAVSDILTTLQNLIELQDITFSL